MPISAFTGPPGAGKSHALVKDVILTGVKAGRRVLTNIAGVDPDAIKGYLLSRLGPDDDATKLGEVVTFHGDEMLEPGFWPDETTAPGSTVVLPGDLVVVDEWALYFPRRGAWPKGCNVEAFLRWHRHLTHPVTGQATDVAIGTQVPADIHQNIRPLIQNSYKFKKLTALGARGKYSWLLFDGHLQPKGGHYRNGTGDYDKEIFPLYASSSAAKEGTHVELKTNAKESIWNDWKAKAVVAAIPLLFIGGPWLLWNAWNDMGASGVSTAAPAEAAAAGAGPAQPGATPPPPPAPVKSAWRIVGVVDLGGSMRVVVADKAGTTRLLQPGAFDFDDGRPVSGMVDGERATAEDRLPDAPSQTFGVELGQ